MDQYKTNIKREIMFRLKLSDDFDLLHSIMMDLVNEGKVLSFYVAKNIQYSCVSVKHLIITSNQNKSYTITFNNIKSDYRDSVISFLIK